MGLRWAIVSGFLLYQNPNNVNDQFTYTVTDGYGGTNIGIVNIVLNNRLTVCCGRSDRSLPSLTNGFKTITYTGIPGFSYSVNRTTNLLAAGWTTIWTTNMPPGGVFQFTDPNPTQPTAFYQLLWTWY